MPHHPVHYRIVPISPEAHLFRVECTIHQPAPDGQVLRLPNWIPGSYMIRDFARNIVWLKAEAGGQELKLHKLDKSTWQIAACSGPLRISYEVYAWDLSVRSAHLDKTHAYFNGTSVFVEVSGQSAGAHSVEILPPPGADYSAWRVATTLPRLEAPLHGFGLYQAADYDELIDHPVEMGHFSLANFEVAGVRHEVAITGLHRADMNRLCSDLQKICTAQVELFGELPAMEHYLFQVMAVGEGYGGLEHRSSTSLLCSRDDLPLSEQSKLSDNYRNFLGLCSHEYFHLWNVKRIKPQAFMPYDLRSETYTRQLWAFEGITSYYDDLALLRSGVINSGSYLELLGQMATRVWRGKGRLKQSVADSSFDAWTKFYKQDENAPNSIVSYYTKGALLALALDLTLRSASGHKLSIDDLMRRLWRDYGKVGRGVPEGAIEQLASELAGEDLGAFFAHYLHGTEDPPLQALLAEFGIAFNFRPATSAEDKGGTSPRGNDITRPLSIGARIANDAAGARLSQVFDDGPAQRAGLSAGDVIIAVDQIKVSKSSLESFINRYTPGSRVLVHAFRRDELYQMELVLEAAPLDTVFLTFDDKTGQAQIEAREKWLGTNQG